MFKGFEKAPNRVAHRFSHFACTNTEISIPQHLNPYNRPTTHAPHICLRKLTDLFDRADLPVLTDLGVCLLVETRLSERVQ